MELRKLGHEAYSCDIEPCSGGHSEWHIEADVLPLINGNCAFRTADGAKHVIAGKWDMLICFPPCTYLSNAGAKHLFRGGKLNEERYRKGLEAKAFFMTLLNADCPRVAVENPVSSRIYEMPAHSQEIQPYQFGHKVKKKTRLWLKNLPKLIPTDIVEPEVGCHKAGTWFMKGGKDRQKNRAKTFQGVAAAMALQWAGNAKEEKEMADRYRVCPHCGAHLDFGEKCDCEAAADSSGNAEPKTKERAKSNDRN